MCSEPNEAYVPYTLPKVIQSGTLSTRQWFCVAVNALLRVMCEWTIATVQGDQ